MADVSAQKRELSEATSRARLILDLVGGTPAMREAGEEYIPRGSAEAQADHAARVNGAVLLPGYKRTRDFLAGQIFARDVTLEEDASEEFMALAEDIDAEGTNLSTWAQAAFKSGIDAGACFILVDHSRVETRTRGGGELEYRNAETGSWERKTKEADRRNGWRPYFVIIHQPQVLGWRMERHAGTRQLTQFRFMERALAHKGEIDTEDVYVDQVRILEPGRFQIWREDNDKWTLFEEGPFLDEVPVEGWFPGEKTAEFCAYPALEDLAYLNLRHWQATADQVDLMSWVRRPAWFGKMLVNDPATERVVFGPSKLVHSTSPDSDLRSVGVDPASVEAGRRELTDLEERMALFGLSILMPKGGTVTATESALNKGEATSTLKGWAQSFKDALERAFEFAAAWLDLERDQAPGVMVNTEFVSLAAFEPQVLVMAVEKGILPRAMAFEEFRRRGLLRDDADWAEAEALFTAESRIGAGPTLDARQAGAALLGTMNLGS
jgi:hypothetical protein